MLIGRGPTRAPWDLVVVAPGAVRLTDGRGQLLAGQPVAVVAKVGDPGSHRVVGREDAPVERGLGGAAGDSWREGVGGARQKGQEVGGWEVGSNAHFYTSAHQVGWWVGGRDLLVPLAKGSRRTLTPGKI